VTLISQPGSDYQIASISLDAGYTRDLILLLIDVHAVLDHLYLDGTQPEITAPAEDYLRESASPYTLPALIDALGAAAGQLSQPNATRSVPSRPARPQPDQPPATRPPASNPPQSRPQAGARSKENSNPGAPECGAKPKQNSGASWGHYGRPGPLQKTGLTNIGASISNCSRRLQRAWYPTPAAA